MRLLAAALLAWLLLVSLYVTRHREGLGTGGAFLPRDELINRSEP